MMRSTADKSITLAGMVFCGIIAAVVMFEAFPLDRATPEPPLPVIIEEVIPMTLNWSLVKVDCYFNGNRRYGNGVIMDGYVITSEMIFTSGVESIVVTFLDGSTVKAEIHMTNSIFGLTALKIDGRIGVEFDDAPNLPPDATTVVHTIDESVDAQVVGYISQDWMLITGVGENCVGAPLVNGGEVSGLVIGMNRANVAQAIAVGNRTLNRFAELLGKRP